MKHNLKYVISLVFMLLLTQSTWADPTVTIIKKLNGAVVTETSPGDVTQSIANSKCTLTVTPAQDYYVTKDFITAYSVVNGNVAQTPRRSPDLDNDPIEVSNKGENTDPTGETTYEFTMPADGSDVEVTVDFHSYQSYNLFIGETQVTDLNAENVLGDSKVVFSVGGNDAPVYTLTLDGAELTVPLFIGLPNLTIDIQGENSITTEETCIQNLNQNDDPSLTFKSTSDEVGSLILTHEGGISQIGEGSVTVSSELAVLLTVYGYNDYTSRLYYMTDGSTSVAKIVPSLGVQVGETQVYSGNADNVFGWYDEDTPTVMFDAENHKLTLNKANISGIIRSSLPNLTIELVGNNSISSGGDRTLQAGSPVNMTIQSTAGNGCLNMHKTYSSELGNFVDDNVNLTITSPLSVISGDLTSDETENHYYATIGVNYDLWISGTRVTSANASNIWDGTDFEFDATASTLYYRSGGSTSYPVLSGLPSLTIKIGSADGDGGYSKNNIGIIKFGAPEGVTIAAENGSLTISKLLDDDDAVQQFDIVGSGGETSLIQGFTTVDYSDFVPMANGITYNTDSKQLEDANEEGWNETTTFVTANGIDISAPTMSGTTVQDVDGIQLTLSSDYNSIIKYSVDYVDENETDITDATYDNTNKPTISKPATVTAKVLINGYEGATTTGKYFAPDPNPFRLVYGADPVNLNFAPAIEEEDGISVIGIEANVTYDSQTGKISSSTMGRFSGPVAMSATEGKTVILNNYFYMNFEVVPPAPTITLASGSYSNTHAPIEITAAEIDGAIIKYQWNDGYTNYYEEAIPVQNGTLKAWVEYLPYEENEPVVSDIVTAQYTVSYPITFVGSNSWASYYVTEDLAVPEGLTAYIVDEADDKTGVVTVSAISYIPRYEAVLLKRTNTAVSEYIATAYDDEEEEDDIINLLEGTYQETSVESILEGYVSDASVYVLYNNEFVKTTSGTIPANRGYLVFGKPANAPKLTIEIGDGATGINDVRSKMAEVGSDFYDLSGRKLSGKPTKSGLYIKNGTKVLVK